MATMSVKDKQGNWITVQIQMQGEIKVINPGDPGYEEATKKKEQVDNG